MKRDRYEPTLDVLKTLVEPGDVVFDVGANFGIYSLVLAQQAGPTGRVYAFEPGEEALVHLRRNISFNSRLNVEVVPTALSNREGTGTLAHISGPQTYSLLEGRSGEPVDLITLDTWSARSHAPAPSVVKADVEGHEPAVFEGGRSTLERAKPLLMFEVSFDALRRSGYEHDSSWRVLSELGYDFFRLGADEKLERLGEVEEGNIFAAHLGSEAGHRLTRTDSG
jgi:FkbM family methyltransferase